MRSWILTVGGVCAFFVGLATSGCDDAEEAFDCQQVCSRYQDCYDTSYDVGACRARCRTASDNNAVDSQRRQSVRSVHGRHVLCVDGVQLRGSCSSIVP